MFELEVDEYLVEKLREIKPLDDYTLISLSREDIAIIDNGECFCYKCNRFYNLNNDSEGEIFSNNHIWFAEIDKTEYYVCIK